MTERFGRLTAPGNAEGQLALDWDLDAAELSVWAALRWARGRAAAVGCAALAQTTGIPPREVQHVVHRLRVEHGRPIASTAAAPAGYYIPVNADEIEAFVDEQRKKALGTLAAIAAVRRVALPELLGQMALECKS
jgi:hypothetical protein